MDAVKEREVPLNNEQAITPNMMLKITKGIDKSTDMKMRSLKEELLEYIKFEDTKLEKDCKTRCNLLKKDNEDTMELLHDLERAIKLIAIAAGITAIGIIIIIANLL